DETLVPVSDALAAFNLTARSALHAVAEFLTPLERGDDATLWIRQQVGEVAAAVREALRATNAASAIAALPPSGSGDARVLYVIDEMARYALTDPQCDGRISAQAVRDAIAASAPDAARVWVAARRVVTCPHKWGCDCVHELRVAMDSEPAAP